MIRTGLGYDLHRLVEDRQLILGGVHIPSEKGEAGHSDGDVLLHAIIDALLGAAALGDIGEFFPPNDNKWLNANSADLLNTAWHQVCEKGWHLENIDCVIALQKPKFLPYRTKICKNIAQILNVNEEQIFVKAKTGEHLGSVGTCQAIEAWASCLLSK
ncbi:MAG: 2-C-methyl-D-erythritol 2,4-cyclodiphosphate synthase [Treponema sp. CETP13]|nr:MAG: 2-C-methyl-D-erythritol 2,4-cyclodiphosphate synthase [Treponema sp. CETP13]